MHGGSISGTVKDAQGGVLPGATVTVQGIDATESITTTSDGAYHFLDLAPGSYKITAALSGFTTLIRDGVMVEVGQDIDVSFTATGRSGGGDRDCGRSGSYGERDTRGNSRQLHETMKIEEHSDLARSVRVDPIRFQAH